MSKTINNKIKLILALQQVDNLTNLLQENEYQNFLYSHLISIRCELERQLTILTHSDKVKE